MNILILGNADDPHSVHLHQALKNAGAFVEYWDTRYFPTQCQLSWSPGDRTGQITLPTKTLALHEIRSVFWRSFLGVAIPTLPEANQQRIALNDSMSVLRSLLQLPSIRWVNSWQAYQFHKEKPLQLSTVHQLGVKIPDTLVTNDAIALVEFVNRHSALIFKPVYGGAHAQWVTPEFLQPERLRLSLKIAPVTLQEYIPGTNIRTYVIDQTVYAAEIKSSALDFREDAAAKLTPIVLPEAIRLQSIAIANALFLEWTAIDWRLTLTGDYVFLEANPSPMFIHFEQQTNFPITDSLVNLLMR